MRTTRINQFAALPFDHHAVVADTQAPQAFEFTLESRAGSRGVAEQVDDCNQPLTVRFGQRGQSLGR